MFRKVRISKVGGKPGEAFPTGTVREGWERDSPRAGARYSLYQDNGKVYRTGFIQHILPNGFVTTYSTYKLEILEEDGASQLPDDKRM
jgi:hypothetical protein